jgi:hypothetical protein
MNLDGNTFILKSNNLIMKTILFLISFSFLFTAKSQTIVNTYDLVTPIDSIWSVTSELQGTFAAGNGVFTALNSGLGLGRKLNDKTEVWFLGGYNSASESQNRIYSTGFTNFRTHYFLTKKIQVQAFYQNQFNSALKINNRSLVGLNATRRFKTNQAIYNLTAGAFYEDEFYSDQTEQTLFRGNLTTSISTELSNLDIHLTLYFQPDLLNLQDYRMLQELSLQFPVSDQLKFEIESALRYDSEPHLNLLALDFSTVMGIVYSISN